MRILSKIVLSVTLLVSGYTSASENIISAKGMGTVDMSVIKNKMQAKMMAKRAAQVDAQRQLAESVKGVRLTGGTTVEEMEVTSDIVATRVKGMLRGAFILDSKVYEEGGSYVAEMDIGICVNEKDDKCKGKPTLEGLDKDIN